MVFKAFWVVTYAIYLGFEKPGKCLISEFMKGWGKPSAKRYAHHQVTFPNVDFFEVIMKHNARAQEHLCICGKWCLYYEHLFPW